MKLSWSVDQLLLTKKNKTNHPSILRTWELILPSKKFWTLSENSVIWSVSQLEKTPTSKPNLPNLPTLIQLKPKKLSCVLIRRNNLNNYSMNKKFILLSIKPRLRDNHTWLLRKNQPLIIKNFHNSGKIQVSILQWIQIFYIILWSNQ